MTKTGTPHNSGNIGDIAKTVIMPGDPLRAKLIADTYLEDVFCYNTVRNVLGYTGTYKGKRVSVQASGMGCPSIGIYSYELYNHYDVDNIIRVGSAGAFMEDAKLGDLIIAQGAATDSNYASQYNLPGTFTPPASYELVEAAVNACKENNREYTVGSVLSSDFFYNDNTSYIESWKKMGILCAEMEAMALYCNAARLRKNALCILTVSDQLVTNEFMTAEQRQTGFGNMITTSLEMMLKL